MLSSHTITHKNSTAVRRRPHSPGGIASMQMPRLHAQTVGAWVRGAYLEIRNDDLALSGRRRSPPDREARRHGLQSGDLQRPCPPSVGAGPHAFATGRSVVTRINDMRVLALAGEDRLRRHPLPGIPDDPVHGCQLPGQPRAAQLLRVLRPQSPDQVAGVPHLTDQQHHAGRDQARGRRDLHLCLRSSTGKP
jgi:hypothetical protein